MSKNSTHAEFRPEPGVTLVELAIVLVIIGLLVTGVLAGRSLIQQAKVDKDISSITGYRTAMETFRLKYKTLPGDLKNATTFWPDCESPTSGILTLFLNCNGDGNGIIDNGEPYYVFEHLSRAGMIAGFYRAVQDNSGMQISPALISTGQNVFPTGETDTSSSDLNYDSFFGYKATNRTVLLFYVNNNPVGSLHVEFP